MLDSKQLRAVLEAAERYALEALADRCSLYPVPPDPAEFRRLVAEAVLRNLRERDPA